MPFTKSISWPASSTARAWQGCATDGSRVWLISDRITDSDPHVLSNNIEQYNAITGARESIATGVYEVQSPINGRNWCFADGFYHAVDGYLYICCTDYHTNSSVETECQIVVLDPDNSYSVITSYNLTSTRPAGDGSIESVCWHEDGWFVCWSHTFNVLRYSNTQGEGNSYFDTLLGSYEIPRPSGVVIVSPYGHSWQGMQFIGDTLFLTLHNGNPSDAVDAADITQARWSGFDFRPVAKHTPPSNGCGQGLAINTTSHLFYFSDRRNNALVRAQGVDLDQITNDSLASDGEMFINMGSPATLDDLHLGAMTISVEINPASIGENGTGRIASHRSVETGSLTYGVPDGGWLFFTDGTASLGWQTITTTASVAQQQRGAPNQIIFGVWQHVLLTFNYSGDKKAHIYVNGVEISYVTNTAGGTPGSNASGDFILRNTAVLNRAFDGKMRKFAVWDSVLSASDIALLAGGAHPNDLATPPLDIVLDIDPAIEVAGSIAGTVYEKNASGVYVPGPYPVRVYKRSDGSLVASTTSAEDGTYTVSDLPLLDEEGNLSEYYVVALDTAATWQSPGLAEQVFPS